MRNKKLSNVERELINLLKSGNFSVHYHDNGSGSVYTNRFEYEAFTDPDTGKELHPGKEVFQFDGNTEGYLPEIIKYLVIALGGKCGTV